MALCPSCLSESARVELVAVDATEFGLPGGVIRNVERVTCAECNEVLISVPAHGAVMKEYRARLATLESPLTGAQFSYLRRCLGVSGKAYAEALGVTNVTVSRIENGESVPAIQDALIRALTMLDITAPGAIDRLSSRVGTTVEVDAAAVAKSRARDLLGGWKTVPFDSLDRASVSLTRQVNRQVDSLQFEMASNSDVFDEPMLRHYA